MELAWAAGIMWEWGEYAIEQYAKTRGDAAQRVKSLVPKDSTSSRHQQRLKCEFQPGGRLCGLLNRNCCFVLLWIKPPCHLIKPRPEMHLIALVLNKLICALVWKRGFLIFFFFFKSNFLLDIFYRRILQGSWHARLSGKNKREHFSKLFQSCWLLSSSWWSEDRIFGESMLLLSLVSAEHFTVWSGFTPGCRSWSQVISAEKSAFIWNTPPPMSRAFIVTTNSQVSKDYLLFRCCAFLVCLAAPSFCKWH